MEEWEVVYRLLIEPGCLPLGSSETEFFTDILQIVTSSDRA